MVLEHDLHRPEDRGGLGLELSQATGNLPKSRDPGTAEAKDGSEGGGVHGRRCRRSTLAPLPTGLFAPVAWLGPKALTLVGFLRCPWGVSRLGWGGFRFGHG